MRLWSKQLIGVLPNNQLKGQWRECCAIAKSIKLHGTPNHLLVNKVTDYPLSHLAAYGKLVDAELDRRGIGHRPEAFTQYFTDEELREKVSFDELFAGWHDMDYTTVCYYNLYEKWTCGGITFDEWDKIQMRMFYLWDLPRIKSEPLESAAEQMIEKLDEIGVRVE